MISIFLSYATHISRDWIFEEIYLKELYRRNAELFGCLITAATFAKRACIK